MSVTIQCAIKSIRDKLIEIEEILKVVNNFDIEQDVSLGQDEEWLKTKKRKTK